MTETVQTVQQETKRGEAERTNRASVYVPNVDIYDTQSEIVVIADMAGVNETSASVTLENDVLTIEGKATVDLPPDHRLVRTEFGVGDYRRVFTLNENVDREGIKAVVKDGVLRITLPKAAAVKARKISVAAG